MGGAAAGTKWIHHIQRLSAAKVSTEAVERGQSRVIDASLTLIRERAKLKVSACIHSPAHSLKFPSFLSLLLILPIPYCSVSALVLLNILFHANMRFESIGMLLLSRISAPLTAINR